MPKKKTQRRPYKPYERNESRASETLTVLWSLSVVMALVCVLMAVAARVFIWAQPESDMLPVLEAFALLAACAIGVVSLMLVPVVYRVRTIPPPTGLVVFGVMVAVAPWITVLVRSLR